MMYDIKPWNFSIAVLPTLFLAFYAKTVSSFLLNSMRQVLQAGFRCCTNCKPPFHLIPIQGQSTTQLRSSISSFGDFNFSFISISIFNRLADSEVILTVDYHRYLKTLDLPSGPTQSFALVSVHLWRFIFAFVRLTYCDYFRNVFCGVGDAALPFIVLSIRCDCCPPVSSVVVASLVFVYYFCAAIWA